MSMLEMSEPLNYEVRPPRGSGWVSLAVEVSDDKQQPTRYRVVVLTSLR